MATFLTYFTNAQDVGGFQWSNESNAESSNNTYASESVNRFRTENESLRLDNINDSPSGGTISKVEIGVEYYASLGSVAAADAYCYMNANTGGGDTGDYVENGASLNTSDAIWWTEITSGSNMPASWTWNDVENLFVDVWGENDDNKNNIWTLYVDAVHVRVTHTDIPAVFNKSLYYYGPLIAGTPANSDLSSDNFDDNSLDAGIWTNNDASSGTTSETNQRIEQSITGSGDSAAITQGPTTGDFDVNIKVVSVSGSVIYALSTTNSNNSAGYSYIAVSSAGSLSYKIGSSSGSSGSVSFPVWLRMKRFSGSEIYLYYSSDGSDWTLYQSGTDSQSSVYISLLTAYNGGTGTSITDDFQNNVIEATNQSNEIKIYKASTGMTEYMNAYVNSSTGYIPLSGTGHDYATRLRMRKGGTTYAVLKYMP